MKKAQLICSILLAIPLVVFGSNYFLNFIPLPEPGDSVGENIIVQMREGGLMAIVALSHVAVGVLLLVPRTRFAAALLQLTLTVGITAFHITLMPAGLGMAIGLLVLNLGALADPPKLKQLLDLAEG